jgi:hypothetical protein
MAIRALASPGTPATIRLCAACRAEIHQEAYEEPIEAATSAPAPQSSQPEECKDGCHYKPGSGYSYYTNCTDGSKCALEAERAKAPALPPHDEEPHSNEYQSPHDRAISFQDCQYESVEDETKWLEANFADTERISRKEALEEAAQHFPSDYNGSEWDWECSCGLKGRWGDDTWKGHLIALAGSRREVRK